MSSPHAAGVFWGWLSVPAFSVTNSSLLWRVGVSMFGHLQQCSLLRHGFVYLSVVCVLPSPGPAATLATGAYLWELLQPSSYTFVRCLVALAAVAADYNALGRQAAQGRIPEGAPGCLCFQLRLGIPLRPAGLCGSSLASHALSHIGWSGSNSMLAPGGGYIQSYVHSRRGPGLQTSAATLHSCFAAVCCCRPCWCMHPLRILHALLLLCRASIGSSLEGPTQGSSTALGAFHGRPA